MNKSPSTFKVEDEDEHEEEEDMSREFWEARYQSGDMPWEKGAPSPGLVDFLAAHPDLPRGTVCVPGCGTGHDVREFARTGFAAFGFDTAPSAIRLAAEKTTADGNLGAPASCRRVSKTQRLADGTPALPGGLNASFQLADFLHDNPPQKFDWLFEHTLFCAIKPQERDDYVRAALRWLKPDGQYLAVNYMIVEDSQGPPFQVTRDELWKRFSPRLELVSEWIPRSYPNRTGRERMFWWRRKVSERNAVEKRPTGG